MVGSHLLDHDRRWDWITQQTLWVDLNNAAGSGKPEAAVRSRTCRGLLIAIAFRAVHAVVFTIGHAIEPVGFAVGDSVEVGFADTPNAAIAVGPVIAKS